MLYFRPLFAISLLLLSAPPFQFLVHSKHHISGNILPLLYCHKLYPPFHFLADSCIPLRSCNFLHPHFHFSLLRIQYSTVQYSTALYPTCIYVILSLATGSVWPQQLCQILGHFRMFSWMFPNFGIFPEFWDQ